MIVLAAVTLGALVVGYMKGRGDGEDFGRKQRIFLACRLNDALEREKSHKRQIAALTRSLDREVSDREFSEAG